MKLFINNKRIRLITKSESIKDTSFDVCISAIEQIDLNKIHGKVLIINASNELIGEYLKLLELKKMNNVESFNFLVENKKVTEKYIKQQYKIVRAAGGIVLKSDKLLMIHRLGVWDFPKGKIESKEPSADCAVREIEEECGVEAEITDKICATWHTYTDKDKKILKKTSWYLLKCIDDQNAKPQIDEQIDEVAWKTYKEAKNLLSSSYESVNYVLRSFKKMGEMA
ncbi:MAG: NUDIX hydrolase [Cytophagales bacterium]